MTKRKKNNVIIGSLLAVVLLMAVGYAAFSSALNISGTGSITSSWNIKITNVEVSNIVGDASDGVGTTYEDLTATLNSNLVSPGDSITYDVTVRNNVSLDAVLTNINLSESTNPAISFSTSNLEAGAELGVGEEAILKVTITYNDVTSQPENTSANLNVTLDYAQKGNSTVIPGGNTITVGGQDVEVVTTGDGLYEDEYESGRYVYKGANPNNYIEFDNGEVWRIIAKEADGTYKVVRNELLPSQAWDVENINDWTTATLNAYLNGEYYTSLDSLIKNNMVSHSWPIGPITYNNDDLHMQIANENAITLNNNIGLITVSDYLRANSNETQCGNYMQNNSNVSICINTDWLFANTYYWTITTSATSSVNVFTVSTAGNIGRNYADVTSGFVRPSIFLSNLVQFSGSGTSSDPYVISN